MHQFLSSRFSPPGLLSGTKLFLLFYISIFLYACLNLLVNWKFVSNCCSSLYVHESTALSLLLHLSNFKPFLVKKEKQCHAHANTLQNILQKCTLCQTCLHEHLAKMQLPLYRHFLKELALLNQYGHSNIIQTSYQHSSHIQWTKHIITLPCLSTDVLLVHEFHVCFMSYDHAVYRSLSLP